MQACSRTKSRNVLLPTRKETFGIVPTAYQEAKCAFFTTDLLEKTSSTGVGANDDVLKGQSTQHQLFQDQAS